MAGPLRPQAGPCRRSEAAESRCRIAATHGAGEAPVVTRNSPSIDVLHQTGTVWLSSVWAETRPNIGMDSQTKKVWGRKYELPEKYGIGRRTVRRDDNLYVHMVTPGDQVRRLRRVLDVLAALASVLDGRSRVVDGRERRMAGPLRPQAGPCRRSEAAESRCRMAAAHGAKMVPMAV